MYGLGNIMVTANDAPNSGFAGANNGLSPSTIQASVVVLGQDTGEAGNPAVLISDREIPANGQSIFITTDTALGATTQLAFTEPDFLFNTIAHLVYAGAGSATGFQIVYDNNSTGAAGQINFLNTGAIGFASNVAAVTTPNFVFLGRTILKKQVLDHNANFALSAALSLATHTNFGAAAGITGTLPAAPELGEVHTFYIENVNGITVTAQGGTTIRINTLVTAANGSVNSIAIGSTVTLEYRGNSQWIATAMLGTWT